MKSIQLRAGELLLRRAWPNEARDLHAAIHASLPELAPYLPWARRDYDLDAARAFLSHARAEEEAGRAWHLSIFEADGGGLIGGVGLMGKVIPSHAEIGYWIRSDRAGSGHATAASRSIMGHGFEKLGFDRIYLTCDVENRASRRVAEKLGMRREGRMKEYLECEGRARDHYLYAILQREFSA